MSNNVGFASKCSIISCQMMVSTTQNWTSLTCDSFPLIMSHIFSKTQAETWFYHAYVTAVCEEKAECMVNGCEEKAECRVNACRIL